MAQIISTVNAYGVQKGPGEDIRDNIFNLPNESYGRYWLQIKGGAPVLPTSERFWRVCCTLGIEAIKAMPKHERVEFVRNAFAKPSYGAGSNGRVVDVLAVQVEPIHVEAIAELVAESGAVEGTVYGAVLNSGLTNIATRGGRKLNRSMIGSNPVLLSGRWAWVQQVWHRETRQVTWVDGVIGKITRSPNGTEVRTGKLIEMEKKIGAANLIRGGLFQPTT